MNRIRIAAAASLSVLLGTAGFNTTSFAHGPAGEEKVIPVPHDDINESKRLSDFQRFEVKT